MNGDITTIIGIADETDETDGAVEALLDGVNDVVGLLANWFQVVTTLIPLIKDAVSDGPDTATLLAQIQSRVQSVQQQQLAADVKKDKADFNNLLTAATDDLNNLLVWGKYGSMINEPQYFTDTQKAAFVFRDPEVYWLRPYVEDFVFYQDFSLALYNSPYPSLPVVAIDGALFVYDPLLPMAAFVEAICVFTQVITIFHADTNDAGMVQPYFTDLAGILDREHQRATAGLVMVSIPPLDLLIYTFQQSQGLSAPVFAADGASLIILSLYLTPPGQSWWYGEIGVADIYAVFGPTGYSSSMRAPLTVLPTTNLGNIIDVHPAIATLLLQVNIGGKNGYRWFRIRMRIGNLARFKALYIAKGYDRIWALIQKLRRLSGGHQGEPVGGFPPAPVEVTDRNAHWCLSDFDAIISEPDPDVPPGGGYHYHSAKWVCAWNPSDDKPSYCARTGSSLQITAEGIITRLQAVLDNSTNHPTDPPSDPVYLEPLPRPLYLRKTILAVAY